MTEEIQAIAETISGLGDNAKAAFIAWLVCWCIIKVATIGAWIGGVWLTVTLIGRAATQAIRTMKAGE